MPINKLRAAGPRALRLECRDVKARLSALRNETDRNDARGPAQLVRQSWFRQAFVKSGEAQRVRRLLVGRNHLLNESHDLENCIRGSLRMFGLRVGTVMVRTALHQAANVLLLHGRWSLPRTWTRRVARRCEP